MPLEHERSFSAESPVGRYWLQNCVGFRVEGVRWRAGIVEEVGLGPDGVDVLAVRRPGVVPNRLVLIPAQRVEWIHPWDDTIVLASRRRNARNRRVAQARQAARALKPVGQTAAVESGRAVREGVEVILRVLGAFGTLLLGLAVVARANAPRVLHGLSQAASALKPIAQAYASEAQRGWRRQRDAFAAWRESRYEGVQEPGDEGPLTRAGDDGADAHLRDEVRR